MSSLFEAAFGITTVLPFLSPGREKLKLKGRRVLKKKRRMKDQRALSRQLAVFSSSRAVAMIPLERTSRYVGPTGMAER